jgi:tRNA pseudouridine55 synthase
VPPVPASAGDGLLLVDKPAGVTSHDIVARVRRAQGTRRVGHAGTLDPFATGLLVCAVGHATRLLPYIQGEPKVYRARVAFGTTTATDDATGEITGRGPAPDWARWDDAVAALTGPLAQVPPAYSAKHLDGERAYARARRGESVALPPVPVTVHGWERHTTGEDWADVTITCSGGTYVRALARDLGRALGTVAHCATLRRLASGPLSAAEAVLAHALVPGARLALRSPLEAMPHLLVLALGAEAEAAVRQGRAIPADGDDTEVVRPSGPTEGRAVLVAGPGRRIVAVAERRLERGRFAWQPRVVLPAPAPVA